MVEAGSAQPFRVNSNARRPLSRGIGYGMLYDGRSGKIPTIPQPVFSSLFQRVLVHRWQISTYISRLRNYGMRPDYPAAHVHSIINSAPSGLSTTPGQNVRLSRFGRPSQKGTMAAPRRFRKALPTQRIPFTPPEY